MRINYYFLHESRTVLHLSRGAEIIGCYEDDGTPGIYAMEQEDADLEKRIFQKLKTGELFDFHNFRQYVGSPWSDIHIIEVQK